MRRIHHSKSGLPSLDKDDSRRVRGIFRSFLVSLGFAALVLALELSLWSDAARSEPVVLGERDLDSVTAGSSVIALGASGELRLLLDPANLTNWAIIGRGGGNSGEILSANGSHAFSQSSSSTQSGGVLLISTSLAWATSANGTAVADSAASSGADYAISSAYGEASGGNKNKAFSATVIGAQAGAQEGKAVSTSYASAPKLGTATAASSGFVTTGSIDVVLPESAFAGFALDDAAGYTLAVGNGYRVQLLSGAVTIGGTAFAGAGFASITWP